MSDVPINHPSRGAERQRFRSAMGEFGTVVIDGECVRAVGYSSATSENFSVYYMMPLKGKNQPHELDGATLTERLLMRLVADQEVYWRNRDRRDRVKKRGRSNGEGKS